MIMVSKIRNIFWIFISIGVVVIFFALQSIDIVASYERNTNYERTL